MSGLLPISKELDKLGIPHLLTTRRHEVYDLFNQQKKKFKIFVIADEWGSLFRDTAENLITIGHSMVNKNTTLSSKNRDMDYICVPSKYYKNQFLARGINPLKDFWITGYPPADRIFNKEIGISSWWANSLSEKKTEMTHILFAPTYNRELNILPILVKCEKEFSMFSEFVLKKNTAKVAFKVHPVLPKKFPEDAEFLRNVCKFYGDSFYYHEDSHSDIADAIQWADVVVGDCSGAMLLAIAKDIPVLLYDNPDKEKSGYYDPEGPEWKLRDKFGYSFSEIREERFLNMILLTCFIDFKKESRRKVIDLLYGEHKGSAAKEIANRIQILYSQITA